MTSPDGKPFAMSPQISPQNKKILLLKNGQDSGKNLFLHMIYLKVIDFKLL